MTRIQQGTVEVGSGLLVIGNHNRDTSLNLATAGAAENSDLYGLNLNICVSRCLLL
jgi:hypothetical protein